MITIEEMEEYQSMKPRVLDLEERMLKKLQEIKNILIEEVDLDELDYDLQDDDALMGLMTCPIGLMSVKEIDGNTVKIEYRDYEGDDYRRNFYIPMNVFTDSVYDTLKHLKDCAQGQLAEQIEDEIAELEDKKRQLVRNAEKLRQNIKLNEATLEALEKVAEDLTERVAIGLNKQAQGETNQKLRRDKKEFESLNAKIDKLVVQIGDKKAKLYFR